MTFYATTSTDGWTVESWIFLSIIHKQQGLNPFASKWIGVTYVDSLKNVDLTLISH
jgi:hypothetical protein